MTAGEVKIEIPPLVVHTYPLCKHTDMLEEMKQEIMEICVNATEAYADNYEQIARVIKHSLDKRFGSPFQVVIGEAFACAVTYQENTLLYMFTGGSIAILIWRTVSGFS